MPPVAAKVRTVEEKIRWIGDRAHGIVTREDLLAAGVTRHEIQHRIAIGALRRVFPGVYRTGPLTTEALYVAAVGARGGGARPRRSAAAPPFGPVKRPPPPPQVPAPPRTQPQTR